MMTPLEPLRILQLLASFQFPSVKVKGGKGLLRMGITEGEIKKKMKGKANTPFRVI